MDRALRFERRGWEFKSLRVRQAFRTGLGNAPNLLASLVIGKFRNFNSNWARRVPRTVAKVNLSRHLAIPTRRETNPGLCFQRVEIGIADATEAGRRSGAQRGALENKLRPEVFLSAPLHFLQAVQLSEALPRLPCLTWIWSYTWDRPMRPNGTHVLPWEEYWTRVLRPIRPAPAFPPDQLPRRAITWRPPAP